MQHQLNRLEADFLAGCVDDLERLAQQVQPSGYGHAAAKRAYWDAADGRVRCTPSRWSDVATDEPAERMRITRAYKKLEKLGLVDRISDNGRTTTHLAPTDAGKALVAKMAAAPASEANDA